MFFPLYKGWSEDNFEKLWEIFQAGRRRSKEQKQKLHHPAASLPPRDTPPEGLHKLIDVSAREKGAPEVGKLTSRVQPLEQKLGKEKARRV